MSLTYRRYSPFYRQARPGSFAANPCEGPAGGAPVKLRVDLILSVEYGQTPYLRRGGHVPTITLRFVNPMTLNVYAETFLDTDLGDLLTHDEGETQ